MIRDEDEALAVGMLLDLRADVNRGNKASLSAGQYGVAASTGIPTMEKQNCVLELMEILRSAGAKDLRLLI